jgi:2-methylcitrate dehydratase PrpD
MNKVNKLTNELGRFIAEAKYEDLPPTVIELVKMRILDLLGAGLVGFRLGIYRPLFEILGGKEETTVWGEGVKYPLRDTVLLNSFMAHSSVTEDGSRFTGGHPSSVVIPAALSLGEIKRSDGKDIILSVALGYDIFLRVGRAIYPSTVIRGFQSTPVVGALGSCAACASLLCLDRDRCKNALAIACNLGVGLKEALKASASQPIQVGRSCEGGVLSALYAEKGVPGCDTALEIGFLKAFADQTNQGDILSDLGTKYRIEETYVKIHGGCRGNHAPIDVIQNLVNTYGIFHEKIREIRVKVDSVTMASEIDSPKDGREALLSIPFSIAVALLEGNASVYQFTDEKANDPEVRAIMTRIFVDVDKNLDKEFPGVRGAHAEIILTDGKRFASSIDIARGEPESPLNFEEIKEKFIFLTGGILGQKTEKILDLVMKLERLNDIGELVQKLCV